LYQPKKITTPWPDLLTVPPQEKRQLPSYKVGMSTSEHAKSDTCGTQEQSAGAMDHLTSQVK